MRPGHRLGAVLCSCGVALFAGCSTPPEAMSPAEWIDANPTVFSRVGSYDEVERKEGIARLKALGREQGTAIIFFVLSDPKLDDYRMEVVLARLLADWRDARAIPFLLQNLTVPDDGAVRIASEGLLAFSDNPYVLDALDSMIQADVVRDRLTAADLLTKIGTSQAVDLLAGRLKAELDPEVRAQILVGIIRSRHPRRTEYLVDALTDREEAIREVAWGALRQVPGLPDVDYRPRANEVERAKAIALLRVWLAEDPGSRRR